MRWQDLFASSQILTFNPVLKESVEIRTKYFGYLRKLIRLAKYQNRKYTKSELIFYKSKLCKEDSRFQSKSTNVLPRRMSYIIPYDIAILTSFNEKLFYTEKINHIVNKIAMDFDLKTSEKNFLYTEFEAAFGDEEAWKEVLENSDVSMYNEYLKVVKENINFIHRKSFNVLITANMSAGKSTMINALVGKNISLMQNMSCTSKIHSIVSKPFEDYVTSEYDYDISIEASKKELLDDNEKNMSSPIIVGTHFNGILAGKRMVLFDSPGVNSSQDTEHRDISCSILHSKRYKWLIYVMNATQLATNDEAVYLEKVREEANSSRIIFVINKIDHLISEDEDVFQVIENLRKFIASKGFKNSIICPISARAAYLAKKEEKEGLSRIEYREFDNYIDKFEQKSMESYYENRWNFAIEQNDHSETQELLKNCGFLYFERIIKHLNDGGKINDTSLC